MAVGFGQRGRPQRRAVAPWVLVGVLGGCATGQGGGGETDGPALGATDTDEGGSTGITTEPIQMSGEATTAATSSGDGSTGDPGCTAQTWYPDDDADGHGAMAGAVEDCDQPPGHVESSDDCDDQDPMRHPGLEETCDGQDNDCDDLRDEYSASNTSCNGCALVEYDGHSYAICTQQETWANARSSCEALFSGDLYKIDDVDENDALAESLVIVDPAGRWWTGLNDIAEEGVFVWTDGTAPDYIAWEADEPNDLEGEDCMELRAGSGFGWNDNGCGTAFRFICESPAP